MSQRKLHDIDSLLDEVVTLPSMPESLERILKLINDPNCSLAEVAKAISSDPGIAIKTLRLVNSAYYGLGQQVNTVEHAVVLLGVRVIKNLALTATVFDTISNSADLFLRHSVGCGVAMRILSEGSPLARQVNSADEAFVFGLLHDIGKVILGEYLPAEYAEVVRLTRQSGLPWYRAEREIIGVDHAQVGARLAEKWRLAPPVVNAIAGHHDLSRCDPNGAIVSASLSVADLICGKSGLSSYPHPNYDMADAVWEASALDNRTLAKIVERFFDSLPMIDELIKLAL